MTHKNTPQTTDPRRNSRSALRRKRALIGLIVLGAAAALSSCSITIDGFAQESAEELAEDVGRNVTNAAADTGRPTNDRDLLGSALHAVVDLDNYDDEDYRPSHTGLSDADGDGLDDDSKVEIEVAGAWACLTLELGDTDVESGRCSDE